MYRKLLDCLAHYRNISIILVLSSSSTTVLQESGESRVLVHFTRSTPAVYDRRS